VDRAETLRLFQRTAQWVLPQDNPAYSEQAKAAFRREPALWVDLHANLSQFFAEGFANVVVDADSPQIKAIEAACVAQSREQRERPRAARASSPESSRGVQAPDRVA